ncbi:MAG: Hpt domain-containing protein [Proteobacteria bacterium]|nr:MAG: Hpt domain-containing protein [Pseudomonadota bacterium]
MHKGILDAEIVQGLVDLEKDGSPGLIAELLELLQSSAPEAFDAIAAGIGRSDAPMVSSAAHSLKSSFANLGAKELSRVCMEIEQGARRGDLSSAAERLAELRAGFPAVEEALRDLTKSLSE